MHKPNVKILIIDGLGVGAASDSAEYGDVGADTFSLLTGYSFAHFVHNYAQSSKDNLFVSSKSVEPDMAGKGTTTGHWALFGLRNTKPIKPIVSSWPFNLSRIVREACGEIPLCGTFHPDGTELVRKLGFEATANSRFIAYTSRDAIIQLAASEETIGLNLLRQVGSSLSQSGIVDFGLGRVITRPFSKVNGKFIRTSNRMDFHAKPTNSGVFETLQQQAIKISLFGKAIEIFGWVPGCSKEGQAFDQDCFSHFLETHSNTKSTLSIYNYRWIDDLLHLNKLEEAKKRLHYILNIISDHIKHADQNEVFLITADHGCDIRININENTRELIPIVMIGGDRELHKQLDEMRSMSQFGSLLLNAMQLQSNSKI